MIERAVLEVSGTRLTHLTLRLGQPDHVRFAVEPAVSHEDRRLLLFGIITKLFVER
jgi:hypothetical protein